MIQDLSSWVPGLFLIHDFLDPPLADALRAFLDSRPWRTDVCTPKRTQHYGAAYPELSAEQSEELRAHLPPIVDMVVERAVPFFGQEPNEIMVIEYASGQGLDPHIDGPFWGDVIGSLSLGREAVMRFSPRSAPDQAIDVPLPARSLVLMTGPARHNWYHAIPPLKGNDPGRRVSLTLRTLEEAAAEQVQARQHLPGAAAGQLVG